MSTKTKAELTQEIEVLKRELEKCQARKTDEDRFRALYSGIPIPTYTWQRQADDIVLLDYNDAAAKETQGKIADFVGFSAQEMYPHRPDIQEDLVQCADEGIAIERETEYEYLTTGEKKILALKFIFVSPDLVLVHTEDITERVREQQEADYERELTQSILDTSLDTVAVLDAHTLQYVKWNKALTRISGYSDEEIPTLHPIEDFFDEEEAIRVQATVEELMREGKVTTTVTHINKDGTRFPLDYTGAIIKNDEGDAQYFVFIGRDISERLEAEEALQAQEALLKDIFRTNIDTLEIFDPETMRYVMWNQAVNEISGYSDEEIAEMNPLRDFIEEPELSETLDALKKTLVEGEAAVRTVVISKDGSRTPMDYRSSLVRDPEGNPLYIIAIGRDISEALRLEGALQESEALYRELVENISEVIYALDENSVVTYVSPAIESFLGHSPDQVMGEPFSKFVYKEDLKRAQENLGKLMRGDNPGSGEYRVVNASGEIRWMRVSTLPIMDEDRITGFRGVLTDITAIKRAEGHIERAAALVERQRLARELHDSVTQTLYGIDLFSNAAERELKLGKNELAMDNVKQIKELSHDALGDMRLLIFELRPQILEEQGLAAALRDRLDLVEARTGFSTNIRVVEERPLDPSVEVELYAIATEALNNTLRHSRAEHVGVILEYTKDSVCLMVQDDGIGYEYKNPVVTKGFGLRNMEERAARMGASLSLDSSPGAGTAVKVEVAA